VGEEPESLAREVARSFVLRDVTFERHWVSSKGYSRSTSGDAGFHYVFGGMCRVINTLEHSP
jgi:hypothetical protein